MVENWSGHRKWTMNKDLEELIAFYVIAQTTETRILVSNNVTSSDRWLHCEFCSGVVTSILTQLFHYDLDNEDAAIRFRAARQLLDYYYIEKLFPYNLN